MHSGDGSQGDGVGDTREATRRRELTANCGEWTQGLERDTTGGETAFRSKLDRGTKSRGLEEGAAREDDPLDTARPSRPEQRPKHLKWGSSVKFH